MSRKNKHRPTSDAAAPSGPPSPGDKSASSDRPDAATAPEQKAAEGPSEVKTCGWVETGTKIVSKDFPDSHAAARPLRIAMTAEASAEMIAHAKESLDAEVCGVLVGQQCQDNCGVWVWVKAAIRGTATRKGGAHVTYTQETWDKIHEVKDRDYPDLAIVGWYHTHPGFGVEFSAMDTFIQQNFFPGPTQFALVMDPLSGDEAICVNSADGIEHLGRFWVAGRARNCRLPAREQAASTGPASGEDQSVPSDMAKRLQSLEERLQQVLQATDEERNARHQVRLFVAMLLALAIVIWISFTTWKHVFSPPTPPEQITFAKIPVQIGDKTVLIGAQVVSWELPPKLRDSLIEAVKQQLEAEAKAREEAEKKKQEEAEGGEKTGE